MKRAQGKRPGLCSEKDIWTFVLYTTGTSFKSLAAYENLKKICKERLKIPCRIKVVDILKNPASAKRDRIVAIPTLVRTFPLPNIRLIGDLSNIEKVLAGFHI